MNSDNKKINIEMNQLSSENEKNFETCNEEFQKCLNSNNSGDYKKHLSVALGMIWSIGGRISFFAKIFLKKRNEGLRLATRSIREFVKKSNDMKKTIIGYEKLLFKLNLSTKHNKTRLSKITYMQKDWGKKLLKLSIEQAIKKTNLYGNGGELEEKINKILDTSTGMTWMCDSKKGTGIDYWINSKPESADAGDWEQVRKNILNEFFEEIKSLKENIIKEKNKYDLQYKNMKVKSK